MPEQEYLLPPPGKTLAQAIVERDAAMASVGENAGADWRDYAIGVIREVAAKLTVFTSDEVMDALQRKPHDSRALGPAMIAAAKLGIIEKTDNFRRSRRRHATPVLVWRSRAPQPGGAL